MLLTTLLASRHSFSSRFIFKPRGGRPYQLLIMSLRWKELLSFPEECAASFVSIWKRLLDRWVIFPSWQGSTSDRDSRARGQWWCWWYSTVPGFDVRWSVCDQKKRKKEKKISRVHGTRTKVSRLKMWGVTRTVKVYIKFHSSRPFYNEAS